MSFLSSLFNISLGLLLSLGYAGIFYLLTLDSMMVPAASEAILTLAGVLSFEGRFNLLAVILIATIASLLGSTVSWAIGKYGGRRFLEKHGKYLFIRKKELDRGDAFFRDHGESAVFFGRIIPLVRTYISLPAGIATMGYRRFIVFTLGGTLIFVTMLTLLGYELGSNISLLNAALNYFNGAAIVIALLFAAGIIYSVMRARRRAT
ncbi:MAG: DedA family protein [Thermoplasmata archaeon]|nr:DedA family protein [Candidatus Sysuiplasma acidicola]